MTAKQDFSTPGFKLENEVSRAGNYELEIIGISGWKNIFPWVIEAGTKNRLTTFHISTVEDSTQVPFAVEKNRCKYRSSVYSQKIDLFCNISCMIIRSLQEEVPGPVGNLFQFE